LDRVIEVIMNSLKKSQKSQEAKKPDYADRTKAETVKSVALSRLYFDHVFNIVCEIC
jgi:2-iminoacetate synthase ThiH